MILPPYFLVLDVESVGIHGEGFSVGLIVIDAAGKRLDEAEFGCPIGAAAGSPEGRSWVELNVKTGPDAFEHNDPATVRSDFWTCWLKWKEHGAAMVADCAWPVEARFLAACVDDRPAEREWQGPYPLHELASFRLAAGLNPLGTEERLPDELPVHNALADARQSARLLTEAIQILQRQGERV